MRRTNLRFLRSLTVYYCCIILIGCTALPTINSFNHSTKEIPSIDTKEQALALYETGKIHQAKGEFNEALTIYEQALALDTDNPDIYNGLSIVHASQHQYDLALLLINQAIQLAPLSSYLYNNLGFIYLSLQKYTEAAGAFERAVRLDPQNVTARRNLDLSYEKLHCTNNQSECGQWQEPKQP